MGGFMNKLRSLGRNWSKIALAGLVALILVPVGRDWYKDHETQAAKRKQQAAIDSINLGASLVGTYLASAVRSCTRIGIPEISTCAAYTPKLLQEQAAPMMAKMALDQQSSYSKDCHKLYDEKYCYDLMNRAFQLSLAEPERKSDD